MFPLFYKMRTKTHFKKNILEICPSKLEHGEKMNHNSCVTWAVTKNPNFQVFLTSFGRKNLEQLLICCWLLFANLTVICHCLQKKSALFSSETELFRKNLRWNSAELSVWKVSFSAVLGTESGLLRDFHEMNSTESELKHFWIKINQRRLSLGCQPGFLGKFCFFTKTEPPLTARTCQVKFYTAVLGLK